MTGEDVEAGAYVPWFRPRQDDDAPDDDGGRRNMAIMAAITAANEAKGTFRV